jgi:hypothetical protein
MTPGPEEWPESWPEIWKTTKRVSWVALKTSHSTARAGRTRCIPGCFLADMLILTILKNLSSDQEAFGYSGNPSGFNVLCRAVWRGANFFANFLPGNNH